MNPEFQNYSKSIATRIRDGLRKWEPFHTKKTHLFIKDNTATFYLGEDPVVSFNKEERGLAYYLNVRVVKNSTLARFLLRERLGVNVYKVKGKLLIQSKLQEGIDVCVPEVEWLNIRGFSTDVVGSSDAWQTLKGKQLSMSFAPERVSSGVSLGNSATDQTLTYTNDPYAYYPSTYATTTATTQPRPAAPDWWYDYSPGSGYTTQYNPYASPMNSLLDSRPISTPANIHTSDGRITPSSLGHAAREDRNAQLFSEEERRRFNILGSNHNNPSRRR